MKILSPLPKKQGRLEIIPLIDIMFFLLAAFMMVSLQMQHLLSLKANLPTATLALTTAKPDLALLTVDRFGQVALDHRPIQFPELRDRLRTELAGHPDYPVYIQGEKETTHGSIIYVLDFVRRAGVRKVALAMRTVESSH